MLESTFLGYEPVSGDPPTRRRSTVNPLNRDEYMLHVTSRAHGKRAAGAQKSIMTLSASRSFIAR